MLQRIRDFLVPADVKNLAKSQKKLAKNFKEFRRDLTKQMSARSLRSRGGHVVVDSEGYFMPNYGMFRPAAGKVNQLQFRSALRDVIVPMQTTEREAIIAQAILFLWINLKSHESERDYATEPFYYFEFGVCSGRTMRYAWDYLNELFQPTMVAFDSFEGLPPVEGIDKFGSQGGWAEGDLLQDEQQFIDMMHKHGVPPEKLKTVRGFYDDTLTPELRDQLLPQKAKMIYVDCDLYSSTVPVLEFIIDFLEPGTVILFDDWNNFYGAEDRGERRAWREFRERHPELQFIELGQTTMQASFAFTGRRD